MLDLACLIFGIIILVRGVCPLPGNKEVRGAAAYIVGLILAAAFPLAITVAIIVVWDDIVAGGDLPPDKETAIILYDLGIVVTSILLAALIAFTNAKPREVKRRRRQADYDDYVDDDREDERWDDDNRRDRR